MDEEEEGEGKPWGGQNELVVLVSGTIGEEGSEAPEEEERAGSRPSSCPSRVISLDLEIPRFTLALLFWNHICTLLEDMPSWSASCTRVCWEGILSVVKICSRMASWSGLVLWRFFLLWWCWRGSGNPPGNLPWSWRSIIASNMTSPSSSLSSS